MRNVPQSCSHGEHKVQRKPPPRYGQGWYLLIDILQRLICLGLGSWHLLSTGDLFSTLVIFAAGFIDARTAKQALSKIFKKT
jgi:hypothetical protein